MSWKKIKWKFKKMRFKEKEMDNIMVNDFRDCDEKWRGRSEVQSTWEKMYILKCKPYESNYTSIMKFRYFKDYKKMRRINKMLDSTFRKIRKYNFNFDDIVNAVEVLLKELNKLNELVKECNFLNVDYDDCLVFKNKFSNIMDLLYKEVELEFIGKQIMKFLGDDRNIYNFIHCINTYEVLKEEIPLSLNKIKDELLRRGIYKIRK